MRVDDFFKKKYFKKQETFFHFQNDQQNKKIFLYNNIQLVYSFDLIVYMFLITYELQTISIYYNIIR